MNKSEKKELIIDQVLRVRETGKTNMLDLGGVLHVAGIFGYFELIVFIEDHPKDYFRLIVNGPEALQ